jgi:hypothetical protein
VYATMHRPRGVLFKIFENKSHFDTLNFFFLPSP